MIAVDTSALLAIALYEEPGPACMAALKSDDRLLISAGTLTEALIVAHGRHCWPDLEDLIESTGVEIVPVDGVTPRAAWRRRMRAGAGARGRRASISATASPMMWRSRTAVRSSMSAAISRRRM